jgi:hypothetical protein
LNYSFFWCLIFELFIDYGYLLSDKSLAKIFSHSVGFDLIFVVGSPCCAELFNLMQCHLPIHNFIFYVIEVLLINELPMLISSRTFSMFCLVVWKFLLIYSACWSIGNLFLSKVKERKLVSMFYMWISSFPNLICVSFWFLWQNYTNRKN